MKDTEYKIIEGSERLFRTKAGNIKKVNAFFGPTRDMDEVEFWEERLEYFGIPYCLVFHKATGYTVFCNAIDVANSNKFIDNKTTLS